jgi:EamA domain-containing membrane protein RarD
MIVTSVVGILCDSFALYFFKQKKPQLIALTAYFIQEVIILPALVIILLITLLGKKYID